MIRVTRSFTAAKPAGAVIDYLKDFGHAVDWDPGTESCQRQDSGGPVAVGSRWNNVSRFLGRRAELIYELTVLEPGHLVFIGTNDGATSTDDIQVTSLGVAESEVVYRASLKLHGVSKLATPVVKVALERIADRTVSRMSEVISAL